MFIKFIDCEVLGKSHDWQTEVVYGEFPHYGKGFMKQRVCRECQAIDYIRFTNEEDNETTIINEKLDK